MKETTHIKTLDGLRAIAVFGPMVHHLWPNVPDPYYTQKIAHLGSLGVDLFFVLSGFLITWILLTHRGNEKPSQILRAFYTRRALRIFPLYWLVLAILFAAGLPYLIYLDGLKWCLLYASNIWMALSDTWPGALSPTWSLAVEEQFYIVWPFIILFTPRKHLIKVVSCLCLVAPIWTGVWLSFDAVRWARLIPFGCLDQLGGGALLAVIWTQNPKTASVFARHCVRVGTVAVLVHLFYWLGIGLEGQIAHMSPIWHTSWAILFTGVVGLLVTDQAPRPVVWSLTRPSMRYIGRISYALYLFHLPVAWGLGRCGIVFGDDTKGLVAQFVVQLLVTFGLACLSWHLFEAPLNRLKRHAPYILPRQQSNEK